VREIVLQELQNISEFCIIPADDGAFYFLLKVQTDMTAMELVETLIRQYKVAVIPGTTFGIDDGCYLRVAYGALQAETAQAGISRLVKGLQNILS